MTANHKKGPTTHLTTGRLGEEIATKYLIKKGYKIFVRNYRKPWGEIDIVVKDKQGAIVFVEVKTMREWVGGLQPEDQLTQAKREKLQRVCRSFTNKNPELVTKAGWRMDLVAIVLRGEDDYDIKHYENI